MFSPTFIVHSPSEVGTKSPVYKVSSILLNETIIPLVTEISLTVKFLVDSVLIKVSDMVVSLVVEVLDTVELEIEIVGPVSSKTQLNSTESLLAFPGKSLNLSANTIKLLTPS